MDARRSPGSIVTPLLAFVVATLATWRVTHLLQAEDGPADIFVRLRRLAGDGIVGKLLDCFYCLSLWVAAPLAIITGSTWSERGMLWLALSGGACLLERWKPSTPTAIYAEDPEENDLVLLRQQPSALHDTTDAPPPPAAPTDGDPAATQPGDSDDAGDLRARGAPESGRGASA
jgi:hypothetical protein